jgi:hypothetical protein
VLILQISLGLLRLLDSWLKSAIYGRGMIPSMFSRDQLKRAATLTEEDFVQPDNVVLYGQYILDRKLVRQRRRAKRVVLSV